MGWCSGTEIFDAVVSFVLKTDASDDEKSSLLKTLADALENHDWDCQQDSDHYEHPIVQRVMHELHPDWYEEDDDE